MGQGGNVVTSFQPNLSKSIDSPRIIHLWTRAVTHGARAIVIYMKVVDYIRSAMANLDLNQAHLRRLNSLFLVLQANLKQLEDRLILLPLAQTPKQMNLVGRSIASTLTRASELTGAGKPMGQDTVAKVVSDDTIAKLVSALHSSGDNTEIVSNVLAAQYQTTSARIVMTEAKMLLPAEFFQKSDISATVASRRPYAPNMRTLNTSMSAVGPTLNTAVSLAVRPVQSATQSPVGMSASSSFIDFTNSMSFASSPTASEPPPNAWNNRMLDPEENRRSEAQDVQYTKLLTLLSRVMQACLNPEFSALRFLSDCMHDKDQTVRNDPPPANSQNAQRMWHETAVALTHCLASAEKVREYLPQAHTAKEFNDALELQEYVRCMISFWGDFCNSISGIRRVGLWKGMPGMIPKYMQMIHVPLKEFSKFLKGSEEWIHLAMDTTVLQSRAAAAAYNANNGFGNGGGYGEPETPSENFPSTPLGAALGPAAAATVKKPNAAFMSRYDQYASTTNRRY